MESITEVSDHQGFTHYNLRAERSQICNYNKGKKDKALPGRKGQFRKARTWAPAKGAIQPPCSSGKMLVK